MILGVLIGFGLIVTTITFRLWVIRTATKIATEVAEEIVEEALEERGLE